MTDNEIIKEMQEIRRSVMAHKELTDEIAQDFLHIDQEYTGGSKVWLTTDFFKKVFKHFCHSNFLVKTIELTFEYIIRQEAEVEKKQEEINRQKAEIENLRDLNKRIQINANRIRGIYAETAKRIKAEAVKEFAIKVDDMLWQIKIKYIHDGRPEFGNACEIAHIRLEKLLKETVGDEK